MSLQDQDNMDGQDAIETRVGSLGTGISSGSLPGNVSALLEPVHPARLPLHSKGKGVERSMKEIQDILRLQRETSISGQILNPPIIEVEDYTDVRPGGRIIRLVICNTAPEEVHIVWIRNRATFKDITMEMSAIYRSDATGSFVILEASWGPEPRWNEANPNSSIGETCQVLYTAFKRESMQYICGIVRDSLTDFPICISVPTDNSSMNISESITKSYPELAGRIRSITSYADDEDVGVDQLGSLRILLSSHSKLRTSIIITRDTPPDKFLSKLSYEPVLPVLEFPFVYCEHLMERAYALKTFPLQMIHLSGAIRHLIIFLANEMKDPFRDGSSVVEDILATDTPSVPMTVGSPTHDSTSHEELRQFPAINIVDRVADLSPSSQRLFETCGSDSFVQSAVLDILESPEIRARVAIRSEMADPLLQKVGYPPAAWGKGSRGATQFYKCRWGLCGEKISRKPHAVEHIMTHVDNRCHICDYCGKGFVRKNELKKHSPCKAWKRKLKGIDLEKTVLSPPETHFSNFKADVIYPGAPLGFLPSPPETHSFNFKADTQYLDLDAFLSPPETHFSNFEANVIYPGAPLGFLPTPPETHSFNSKDDAQYTDIFLPPEFIPSPSKTHSSYIKGNVRYQDLSDVEPSHSVPPKTGNFANLLRAAPILVHEMKAILDQLNRVMDKLEQNNFDPDQIQKEIDASFNSLCGEFPGAVTVRHTVKLFKRLGCIDRQENQVLAREGAKSPGITTTSVEDEHENASGSNHARDADHEMVVSESVGVSPATRHWTTHRGESDEDMMDLGGSERGSDGA